MAATVSCQTPGCGRKFVGTDLHEAQGLSQEHVRAAKPGQPCSGPLGGQVGPKEAAQR